MTGTTRSISSPASTACVAGSGRFAADVEQVGTLGDHPAGRRHRARDGIGVREQAVAGERVRRDVEDAHDVRPRPQSNVVGPMRVGAGGAAVGRCSAVIVWCSGVARSVGSSGSRRSGSSTRWARTAPTR